MSKFIGCRIEDPEVWEAFKQYVIMKHGKLHTVLGQELQNALIAYMSMDNEKKDTHTPKNKHDDIDQIKQEISKYVQPGGSIPKQMLSMIIRKTTGLVDNRAIRNRIEALVADGFIIPDVDNPRSIYRVLGYAGHTRSIY